MYTYRQIGDRYVVSLDNGVEIAMALKSFCEEHNLKAGMIYGIGAVNEATLRFFNPATKRYVDRTFSEQMEIANLTGNLSTLDGETYLHLHATFGREDYTALAGHLLSARLNGAGEIVIEPLDGELPRYFNEEIGLNCYDFRSKIE